MSDSLAIQVVTAAVRDLLAKRCLKLDDGVTDDPVLTGLQVTAKPPDKARGTETGNQLNLFLYQTTADAAWRNQNIPGQVKPGETAVPPLALSLNYLLTAYGADDDDALSHRILGRAMHVLNDFPLLGPTEIAQAERVRITPLAQPTDEISKLWMIFQTQYRISTAYQVSVILIDSSRGVKAAPPVLQRGAGDRGATAQAGAFPPILETVKLETQLPAGQLGDTAILQGQNLTGVTAMVFENPYLPDAVRLTSFTDQSATQIKVVLDDQTPGLPWVAGLLALSAEFSFTGQHALKSNAVPFALALTFDLPLDNHPPQMIGESRIFTITGCKPKVLPGQRVYLTLNADGSVLGEDGKPVVADAQLPARPRSATVPADQLEFDVTGLPSARYLARVRVDGVDSQAIAKDAQTGLFIFDPQQKVNL